MEMNRVTSLSLSHISCQEKTYWFDDGSFRTILCHTFCIAFIDLPKTCANGATIDSFGDHFMSCNKTENHDRNRDSHYLVIFKLLPLIKHLHGHNIQRETCGLLSCVPKKTTSLYMFSISIWHQNIIHQHSYWCNIENPILNNEELSTRMVQHT